MKSKIKNVVAEYQLLFRTVPSMIFVVFILSVVLMNLMANKVIFQLGDYVAGDGGLLLSWIPFLCMDTVTKRFGAKASIMINILGAFVNLCCVGIFSIIAMLPGNGEDFSAFNTIFGCVLFILLGSTVAYVLSGIVNSLLNASVGRLFKRNPDGKLAFFSRAYVSTVIGQWLDNFLFAFLVFHIFAPMYWGWGFSITLCLGTGLCGAVLELLIEVIFSPIGYRLVKKWEKNNVGAEWIERNRSHIV